MLRRLLVLVSLAVAASRPAGAGGAYEPQILGVEDKGLRSTLEAVSQLKALQERPPPSVAALRRRAADDLDRLRQAIQAEGYWAPSLDLSIDAEATPAQVRVTIDPGPAYTLQTVTLQRPEGGAPPALDRYHPIAFGLRLGEIARSAEILGAETQI